MVCAMVVNSVLYNNIIITITISMPTCMIKHGCLNTTAAAAATKLTSYNHCCARDNCGFNLFSEYINKNIYAVQSLLLMCIKLIHSKCV